MIAFRVISLMIAAEIFAMAGSSAVPATLPALIAQWQLSAVEAGWLGGAYFVGYAAAVPVLVSLTDRLDPRIVFFAGCTIGVAANVGFAMFSRDLATATVFWMLAGVSLAGVYMPGLRVITERLDSKMRLRAVPYYTASFGIGVSASFLISGWAWQLSGWRTAFMLGAAGCLGALLFLRLATVRTSSNVVQRTGSGTFSVRTVLRNAMALRYIAAYGGHCWELFALRAWLVALLLFAWNRTSAGSAGPAITYWSSIISLAGVPASIIGAEFALRIGRKRLISSVAFASVAIAMTTAWFAGRSFTIAAVVLVLYSAAILGDSGAITTGLVEAATPGSQGSTLALHSLIGFAGGALGPIAVGLALNLAGGNTSPAAWAIALAVMAAGSIVAAAAVLAPNPASRAAARTD